jgi:hypothetical protein
MRTSSVTRVTSGHAAAHVVRGDDVVVRDLRATVEICDRMEAVTDAGVPNHALAEYRAPENYPAAACPMCQAGEAITRF